MSDKGSVFQKGGGGTNFEQSVGAAFITTLIIRGNAPCLPSNEIVEVGFQATKKGYETDDILVVSKSSLGEHRLLIQSKHDISFTLDNKIFQEVINAFWKDFNNAALFDKTRDKLIIVKNGLTKDERNHVKSLFNWANSHATEGDFIAEVNRINAKKERLNVFRECLQEANNGVALTDIELWEFLKCVDVLEYDFLNQGSVDKVHFLNLIKLSRSNLSVQNENEIWNDILAYASRLNPEGGNVTSQSIQEEDFYKNFSIEKLNPYFKSVEKLKSDSAAILNSLKDTIGGVHIDRPQVKEAIIDSLNSCQITIVKGRPGVGKSSLIREVLNIDFPRVSLFVFKADQFNQPHIANVFTSLGVNERIQDIFSCISLIPSKILFIDSLEKLLESDPECAFTQLLALLREFPNIRVVTSCRRYAIDLLINKFSIDESKLGILEVFPLLDNELDEVTERFPQIKITLNNEKIKSLLCRPKYLDFIVAALHKAADDYSSLTLTGFKGKLWNALVEDNTNTKSGLPLKREKAFMEIAVNRAREMKLFIQPIHADVEAITLLQHDEIIIKEPQNNRYAPAHDILEDWALVRYVSATYEYYPNPKDLFEQLGNEPAIRRAFRLWVEDYLQDNNSRVNRIIKASLNNDSTDKYWNDEIFTAVFRSENSKSFFVSFERELISDKASLLERCIHLLRTCCKKIYSKRANSTLLIPTGSGWGEALIFMQTHIKELDELRVCIVSFLSDWHSKLIFEYETVNTKELTAAKSVVLQYIDEVEAGAQIWQKAYMEEKTQKLISILFDLSAIAKEEVKQFIERAFSYSEEYRSGELKSFYRVVIEKCLSGLGNQHLINELPELVLETAWKEWKLRPAHLSQLGSMAGMIGSESLNHKECWGIEDNFSFFPSGIYKTPLYYLLWYHPSIGLRFIVEFINYSVDFYIQADCEYKHEFIQIEVELNDGTRIKKWASWELWAGYRGLAVTHYMLECLLMSLEKYLLEIAARRSEVSKENLEFMFDYLARNSNNVTVMAVLASVAMAYPEEVEDGILPLLRVREFYEWDSNRALQEHMALAPFDPRIPFAHEERFKSNQLPHRRKYRRGLMNFVLDYQFSHRKLNKEIHQILDRFKTSVSPIEMAWKKKIAEMDIRSQRLEEYDEELGGFHIRQEYDQDVTDYIEASKEDIEAYTKSANCSSKLSGSYERRELLEFSEWKICYKQYSSTRNLDTLLDRPVTLAVLGIKNFSLSIDGVEKAWCVKTIIDTVKTVLQNTLIWSLGRKPGYNLLEQDIALSSFHLLFDVIDTEDDKNSLVVLMIYMLFLPFPENEVTKIEEYIRTVFFKQFPIEGKRVWYGLIQYAKFRKSNPYFYDDHNAERLREARIREENYIKRIVRKRKRELNLSEISLHKYEGYLLIRALTITPYFSEDRNYHSFIRHVISVLTDDLKLEDDHFYNRDKNSRQIHYEAVSSAKSYIVELLLNAEREFANSILAQVINPTYQSDLFTRGGRDDLFEFSSSIVEGVVRRLDNIVASSKDETIKKQAVINFWNLWRHLFQRVVESNVPYFTNILLLDISWPDTAVHWILLEGRRDFYYEMVGKLGAKEVQALLNVFSTIGEKTFLPEGLTLIVEICKNNNSQETALTSPSAERLVKRLFYSHMSKIKKDKQLIDNFMWLLNKMVDLGSSQAYFFRENVIAYKSAS